MRRLVCGGMLVCAVWGASVAWGRDAAESGPLPVLDTTLRLVRDKYADPARLRPSELLVGALRQLERDLGPVVVASDDATGVVMVRTDEHTFSFDLSKVLGLWDVAARLREVFAFLRASLPDQHLVLRDLEISACKGLLGALDRNSAWIAPDAPGTAGSTDGQGETRVGLKRTGVTIAPFESRQLRPGIGYVRISHIARSTADELSRALEGFRERGSLQGLVLDLRDNRGGLLAEAAQVADVFLEQGSLALTRGAAEGSEEKKARKDGKEPRCPLVLLTNANTASGSELIASALQKNERAVIVGERSFGAGDIQLIFPSVIDHAAVKLTIAEFQAPAGTTIHGVGVVPDIELKGTHLHPLQPRFFGPFERVRARERHHLFLDAQPPNQPETSIWYTSSADSLESIDVGEQSPRSVASDFALQLATDLVAQLPEGTRSKQLQAARPFLQRVREREFATLGAQLQALGIDWRPRPSTASDGPESSDFAVKVTTDRAHNSAAAGDPMTLTVSVTNRSKLPAYQVRAITKSQNADYHEKELLFGYVGPAQTVTRSVSFGRCEGGAARSTCRLSMSPADREDIVKIAFSAQQGEAPGRAELRPVTLARPPIASGPSQQSPVSIEIGKLPLTTRQERISIKGLARARDGIHDVRVVANDRKVFYRRASPSLELSVEAGVPLAPGINLLRVVARDRNDVTTSQTFIVRRDGPQGEPLQQHVTPATPANR